MINEFMQLAKAIPSGGAATEEKLTPLPKGETFRLLLTAEGKVSDIEVLNAERSGVLRKYMPNKFKSFPGFNQLLIPAIDVWQTRIEEANAQTLSAAQKQERYRRLGIKKIVSEAREELYGDKGLYKKAVNGVKNNIVKFPKELMGLLESSLIKNETISRLLHALAQIENEKTFLADVERVCYEKDLRYEPSKSVSFFLDVEEYEEWPMAHKRSMDRLNEVLCNCEKGTIVAQGNPFPTVDAFGGSCVGVDCLMRDISIPVLGLIKMRSSNKDVEALERYRMAESKSFPIGKSARISAENALRYVIAQESENFTYGRVSPKEILVAYPTEMVSREKIPLVRLFGGSSRIEQERLAFRAVAKAVVDLLKGEGQDLPNRELRIFSIRKMDKARTKVVYYRNIDVVALARASDAWDEGCHNVPSLEVKDWPKGSKKAKKPDKEARPVPVEIETVFPARLYQYLNKYYKRDFSSDDIEVSRFKPSTGMELMLMNECEVVPFAKSILSQLIIQSGNYYRELCLCVGQSKASSAKGKGLHLGILGLLLYKAGKRKENYMNDTAFLLGKFLRIADGLHKCYCENERKDGQCARELCGSAMIAAMMENPTTAFAQLAQRSAPYVKWAQSCQRKECAGLAHWWLRLWQPIADALHMAKLPTRLTDAERAEVFLGYLSSLPKQESTQNADKDLETTETEPVKEND